MYYIKNIVLGIALNSLIICQSLSTKGILTISSLTNNDVPKQWSNYQSNKSLLNSVRAQVNAAEIANEGIVAEYNSGSDRTTLEVIQSRTILLNSRINLASAERDFFISQFRLLSSVGRLTAQQLNLKK